jgi:hypothetical protein
VYAVDGMGRGTALALGLLVALAARPTAAAPPEDEPAAPSPGTDEERKGAAKAEVAAGRAAFSQGEYQAAIDHYEAAMAILPAPKLHYNIGVCHQRLAMQTEAAEDRTRERELAVESYNRYLEENPRAEDRLEVAEIIRELGGTPVTMPALKPLFDGEEPPDERDPEQGEPDPDVEPGDAEPVDAPPVEPPPVEPKKPPYPSHGRFGLMFVGGYSPQVARVPAIDAPGMFAIDLHGGGFLGAKRRFLLAVHTMLYSGAALRADGFSFYGYSFGLLGQYTWVVGREGLQLSFGGVAGVTGQGLNQREDVPPPICSIARGAQIAGRTGGLFAPRFDLGILLGVRRRGMISLFVQPSFAVFGVGPRGEQCNPGETPWTALGVDQRWQFQLWAGAGFSFRF